MASTGDLIQSDNNPEHVPGGWKESTRNLERDLNVTSAIGGTANLPVLGEILVDPNRPTVQSTPAIQRDALDELKYKIERDPEFGKQLSSHYGLLSEVFAPQEKLDYLRHLLKQFNGNEACVNVKGSPVDASIALLRGLSAHVRDLKLTCNTNPNVLLSLKSKVSRSSDDGDIGSTLVIAEMLSSHFNQDLFERRLQTMVATGDTTTSYGIRTGLYNSRCFGLLRTERMEFVSKRAKVSSCAELIMRLATTPE